MRLRKGHFARECRSPKDTRRNGAKPQRRNVLVENSTSNALVSQCDGVGSYDWSFQVKKEPTNYALMAFTSSSSSSDNKVVSCSKAFTKAYATLQSHYDKLIDDFRKSQFDVISYKTRLESVESDESLPPSPIYDRYQSGDGYHVVPPPYTRTFMPPKPELVFHNSLDINETVHTAFNIELSPTKPNNDLSHTHRPSTPIIEDWDVETSIPTANPKIAIPKPTKNGLNICEEQCPKGKSPAICSNDTYKSPKACGNMSYLSEFEELNGGYVAFGGNPKGGKIFGKGKIRTGKLDFDDVYFVKELNFNLFSVLQMCDKKNSVLFTDTECLVLSPEFKLPDENQVLLRVYRENNMYNVDLKNIVLSRDLTCLFAKATLNESNLWHRRLSRINFKTMNTLLKGNLVRGIPTKVFVNDHTCVACKKGKQHRASCKTKPVSSVNQPLQRLHMDLFRPTFVKILNKKSYCLVVTDDYSRGSRGSLVYLEPLNKMALLKGKNRTLIEAARTMLADSLLPIPFWAEAVNTACYAQNRVLVTKPQNKTPYELLHEKAGEESSQQYVLFLVWSSSSTNPENTDDDAAFEVKEPEFEGRKPQSEVHVSLSSSAQSIKHDDKTKREAKGKSHVESLTGYRNLSANINEVNAADSPVPAVGQISTNSTNTFSAVELEDIIYFVDEEDVGAEADFTNLEISIIVSPIPTTRVHKDHPVTQIIGDLSSATQTRSMSRVAKDQGGLSQINSDDFHTCTKWFFRNKKDEKGIVVRNKAQLVTQGHTQEEGIDYKEVFAPVARIEAIRLFLAYASFMGLMVYQMDVKSAFLYGTMEEERGKIDQTLFIKRQKGDILLVQIYVDDIIFGSTNKDLCKAFEKLMKDKFQMSSIGEFTLFLGLQVKQKKDGIFISQDKYVAEILRKFCLTDGQLASTPIDTEKPLLKDPDAEDVNVHTYRSMIDGQLASTPIDTEKPLLKDPDDKKKVVITEATIRDALRLDDAEGIDCLPNEEIFTELARMGYEKPSTKLTF
nr:putative ribonuclease H-like domain-containing protein [Tanacetum cinerariifolium]